MKKEHSAVLACAGAVIGAGFASGHEIVAFFTRYGKHAWWLIVLAAFVMGGLCSVCMEKAKKTHGEWHHLMRHSRIAEGCTIVLMFITAGAMVSAGGYAAALLLKWNWAYGAGVLGTLMAAWLIGTGRLRGLSMISAALTTALLCALLAAMLIPSSGARVDLQPTVGLAAAVLKTVGYASMNMTLAMGVVCRCAKQTDSAMKTSCLFGWLMAVLLMLANYLYSCHPEVQDSIFPLVRLLSQYGRKGYLFSGILLYLSILTTLSSLVCALRSAGEEWIERKDLRMLVMLGIPLIISRIGFSEIVDRLYAPAGLVCLAVVFAPIGVRALGKR